MSDEQPKGLAKPDDYQAKFMAKGALYYDKIRAPLAYHLIFLAPMLFSAVGLSLAALKAGPAAVLPMLITMPVMLVLWLLFSVLRISVTEDEVYVQYGLFGPKIAVRDIEKCAEVDYDWKKYGGWGIRYGRDGSVAYNMMGDKGRAVEIHFKKGGKSKKLLVASPDPERLAAAINEARARLTAAAQPKRIAASTGSDEIMREAEAEAEAIAAEAAAEAKAKQSP